MPENKEQPEKPLRKRGDEDWSIPQYFGIKKGSSGELAWTVLGGVTLGYAIGGLMGKFIKNNWPETPNLPLRELGIFVGVVAAGLVWQNLRQRR